MKEEVEETQGALRGHSPPRAAVATAVTWVTAPPCPLSTPRHQTSVTRPDLATQVQLGSGSATPWVCHMIHPHRP